MASVIPQAEVAAGHRPEGTPLTVVMVGTDMLYGGATHFYSSTGAKDPLRMGATWLQVTAASPASPAHSPLSVRWNQTRALTHVCGHRVLGSVSEYSMPTCH